MELIQKGKISEYHILRTEIIHYDRMCLNILAVLFTLELPLLGIPIQIISNTFFFVNLYYGEGLAFPLPTYF